MANQTSRHQGQTNKKEARPSLVVPSPQRESRYQRLQPTECSVPTKHNSPTQRVKLSDSIAHSVRRAGYLHSTAVVGLRRARAHPAGLQANSHAGKAGHKRRVLPILLLKMILIPCLALIMRQASPLKRADISACDQRSMRPHSQRKMLAACSHRVRSTPPSRPTCVRR